MWEGDRSFSPKSLSEASFLHSAQPQKGSRLKSIALDAKAELSCVSYLLSPPETPGLQRRAKNETPASHPELTVSVEFALQWGFPGLLCGDDTLTLIGNYALNSRPVSPKVKLTATESQPWNQSLGGPRGPEI